MKKTASEYLNLPLRPLLIDTLGSCSNCDTHIILKTLHADPCPSQWSHVNVADQAAGCELTNAVSERQARAGRQASPVGQVKTSESNAANGTLSVSHCHCQ